MKASVGRRSALAVTAALAAVVTVAGCGGSDDGSKDANATDKQGKSTAMSAVDVVNAAYQKLSSYKSAKFTMDMTMPATTGAAGKVTSSGTLGWSPLAMDMTMKMPALGQATAGAPTQIREKMVGTAMYMDFSSIIKSEPALGQALGGKQWLKMDLAELAKQVPGGGAQATSDLFSNAFQKQQNPATQLATMLQSPQISHVGTETVDGVKAEHYKGRLTMDQALNSSSAGKALSSEERKQLGDTMKQAGIDAENIDVWVGKDSFPVRMDVAMDTAKGKVTMSEHLSDYSESAATVKAPPAGETFTLQDMMKLQGGAPAA